MLISVICQEIGNGDFTPNVVGDLVYALANHSISFAFVVSPYGQTRKRYDIAVAPENVIAARVLYLKVSQ